MLQHPSHRRAAPAADLFLDADRLDVYALALAFQPLAARLGRRLTGALRDQLERASLSVLLNLAEGLGRTQPADKARFYAISRGSATECAALVDVLRCRKLADPALCREARATLVRVVQMTTALERTMSRRKGRLSAAARTTG